MFSYSKNRVSWVSLIVVNCALSLKGLNMNVKITINLNNEYNQYYVSYRFNCTVSFSTCSSCVFSLKGSLMKNQLTLK